MADKILLERKLDKQILEIQITILQLCLDEENDEKVVSYWLFHDELREKYNKLCEELVEAGTSANISKKRQPPKKSNKKTVSKKVPTGPSPKS